MATASSGEAWNRHASGDAPPTMPIRAIADALLELQKAGVVVLWRPMQEMNGNWFWWGIASPPTCHDRPYPYPYP